MIYVRSIKTILYHIAISIVLPLSIYYIFLIFECASSTFGDSYVENKILIEAFLILLFSFYDD